MKQLLGFGIIFLIVSCASTSDFETKPSSDFVDPDAPPYPDTFTEYTENEVLIHNSHRDCWILVEDEIYDITSYIINHPDGMDMVSYCGKDVTELFIYGDTLNPIVENEILPNYYIADRKEIASEVNT